MELKIKKKGLSYIAISNNSSTEVIEYLSSKETRSEIIEDTAFFGIVFLLNFIRQKYK